ncbi:MAG: hypothetical protein PHE87_08445 [Victivallaceae bacterium]|nr:hypothetical protein [Victivallaceae bacterium]
MENDDGWIKIWRKSVFNKFFSNPPIWHLFTYCILKANYKERTIFRNGHSLKLEPGQFVFGRKIASDETGLSEQQIRTALRRLSEPSQEGGPLIAVKSTNAFSVVTVLNYEIYQHVETPNQPATNQQLTSDQPATNQQLTTNKNIRSKEREEYSLKESSDTCKSKNKESVSTRVGAREGEASTDVAATHTPKTKSISASRKHDMAVADFLSGKIERPGKFDRKDFTDAFCEWAEKRRDLKKFMTSGAITRAIKHLAPYSPEEAVYLLQQSADHCWTGVVFSGTNPTPPPGQVLRRANGKPVVNVNPELARIFHQGMEG